MKHFRHKIKSKKRSHLYQKILLIFILCFLVRCTVDDDIIQNPISSITISSGNLVPEFDNSITEYNITSLNTLQDILIGFDMFNSAVPIYVNDILVEDLSLELKLEKNQDLVISTLDDNGAIINYTINYIPDDLPKANVITSNNPSDGFTFISYIVLSLEFGITDYSYIAILDNSGFPVYYNKLPFRGVINFSFHDIGGNQKRFSYNNNETGKIVVMDENFKEIKQLSLLANNGHGEIRTDNHDFIYLADNHYILPAYINRENVDMTDYGGSNSVTLTDFLFQEIKDGQVIFEWNSANYPEIIDSVNSIYHNQFNTAGPVDYFHFNSFAIDPSDGHFIISARHTDQIYKIHRITGDIIWRIGGINSDFSLTNDQFFSHQHHATITNDNTLLLFDNNVTQNQQTRILEFDINETDYTVNLINTYQNPGTFMNIMGSVQKFNNGNFFIGWGGHTTSQINATKSDITEIDDQGNIVLDISFTNTQNRFTYSYRALKHDITF